MTTFHPRNRNSWHTPRQGTQGPIISPVIIDSKHQWQCYCKDDGISGEGESPEEAYHDWLTKVLSVEKYMGY